MQRASLLAHTARRLPPQHCGPCCRRPVLAGVQRQDRVRIQAETVSGRLPDAAGSRACLLERNVRRPGSGVLWFSRTLPPALASVLNELAAAGDDLQSYLWFDQKYFLPDNILTKVDHTSMAHAIEVRPPFLDHRIVEFASSLPAGMKIQGSRQKVILRNLMRGKLPPAILNRKKIGFDIPDARLVPRTAAAAARRRYGICVRRTWRLLSIARDRSGCASPSRPARQSRLSSVGLDDTVLLDEKMGNPDQSAGRPARRVMENVFTATL